MTLPGIEIAPGTYLRGFAKQLTWTNANETIGTGTTTVTKDIDEVGIVGGVCMMRREGDHANNYMIIFGSTTGIAFSRGGRTSSTGGYGYMKSLALGDTQLTYDSLDTTGGFIHLKEIYVDTATNQIKMQFKSASSGKTLDAEAAFFLRKGNLVT